MGRLAPVSWTNFVRKLRGLGFEGPLYRGKHTYMVRGQIRITIPNPHCQQISVDLPSRILRQANLTNLTRDEWEALE